MLVMQFSDVFVIVKGVHTLSVLFMAILINVHVHNTVHLIHKSWVLTKSIAL